ncbi:MAG: hypothetical protein GWO24_23160, partial [Akkermansiaceae bacterium]|nr:hypothetical protein [Akkermansiaceae bacterium]
MKLPWVKILLFLIPAVAGTIYLLWWISPEQAISRRADALFASIEKKTLSTGTARQKAEQFQSILSRQLEIQAPQPVPSGSFAPAHAASLLEEFHQGVTSCRISREKETVALPSPADAIYQATVEVDVLVGRSSWVLRYQCRLEFEKSGDDWLLKLVILT